MSDHKIISVGRSLAIMALEMEMVAAERPLARVPRHYRPKALPPIKSTRAAKRRAQKRARKTMRKAKP